MVLDGACPRIPSEHGSARSLQQLAELRQASATRPPKELEKDLSGEEGVARGRVPIMRRDAEPSTEAIQTVVGVCFVGGLRQEFRLLETNRERRRVDDWVWKPTEAEATSASALEHRDVVFHVVPHDDTATQEGEEASEYLGLGCPFGFSQLTSDAVDVNGGSVVADVHVGLESVVEDELHPNAAYRANGHDSIHSRIQAGHLRVDDDEAQVVPFGIDARWVLEEDVGIRVGGHQARIVSW